MSTNKTASSYLISVIDGAQKCITADEKLTCPVGLPIPIDLSSLFRSLRALNSIASSPNNNMPRWTVSPSSPFVVVLSAVKVHRASGCLRVELDIGSATFSPLASKRRRRPRPNPVRPTASFSDRLSVGCITSTTDREV